MLFPRRAPLAACPGTHQELLRAPRLLYVFELGELALASHNCGRLASRACCVFRCCPLTAASGLQCVCHRVSGCLAVGRSLLHICNAMGVAMLAVTPPAMVVAGEQGLPVSGAAVLQLRRLG
jgi:hypothetical protein